MTDHTLSTTELMKNFSTFYENRMRPDRKAELSKTHPDADAFQKLCCELLAKEFKEEFPNMHLSNFPTSGADGAIDFCGEAIGANNEDHFKLIGECKKNDSLENAIDQWKELKGKLLKHLIKSIVENTLYAPWLDPKLKYYVYCTSCNIDTQKNREAFAGGIRDTFIQFSKEPHLEHLKEIAIKFYTWNDLLPLLEKNRFLYHRWVQDEYIAGVEPLTLTIKPDQPQYKDYLSSAKQPYFSRDGYVKQNPETKDLVTETGILSTLLDNPAYDGCIVYGEGGIGKTRLMLELGVMAEEKKWIVFRVIDKRPNLDRLKTMFYPGYRYLLLFDYIEESPDFDDPGFFRQITRLVDGAEVKIIGNCRKTHFDNSELKDAEGFFCRDLSIKDLKLQQDYKDHVVKDILGDLVRLFKVDKSFYRLKPAFAVLLKYHDQKNYITEMELDFRGEGAFREWLKKQLIRTFDLTNYKELSKQEKFFHIFFILSSSTGISPGPLMADFKEHIQALRKDGWVDIEEVNGQKEIKIIHDTIAEEVLILRLRDCKELLEEEIKSIFNFAIAYNGLENCLRLFEQISGWVHDPEMGDPEHLKKKSKMFYRLFSSEIACSPENWDDVQNALTISPLMDEPEIVKLIEEHELYFQKVVQNRSFGLVMAKKLRYFHKNKVRYLVEVQKQFKKQSRILLNQWLTMYPDFFDDSYISSRILASVTESVGISGEWAPGVRIETMVKNWLKRYPVKRETQFVLNYWLKAGGDREIVSPFVSQCLRKYPLEMETRFVICSWLDAGGEKEVFAKFVSGWLEKYPLEMETRFVICSWLNAGGEKEVVAKFVPKWLNTYSIKKETQFVIYSWLRAAGDREIVSPFVTQWLEKYPLEMETHFVIKSWLDAGGEKDVVAKFLSGWLEKYPLEMETHFVIKSWLDARGEREVVERFVSKWLNTYPIEKETQFVLYSWLRAAGDREIVSPFVSQWLEKYPLEMETSFVIKSWLNAGGEKEIVAKFVSGWLEKYPLDLATRFVLCAWLDAGGEKEVVEKFVSGWLEKFPLEMETSFVICSWLDAGGEKEIVAKFVSGWLEKYPLDLATRFVLCSWLDAGGEKEFVTEFVSWWLEKYSIEKEASFVLQSWLDAKGEKSVVSKFVFQWLDRFALERDAHHVLCAWLNAGGNTDLVRQYIKPWIELFSTDKENADKLIKSWLDAGGDPQEVAPFILAPA